MEKELYNARLEVREFPFKRGRKIPLQMVSLFRENTKEIKYPSEVYEKFVKNFTALDDKDDIFLARETVNEMFTKEEIDEMAPYFENYKKTKFISKIAEAKSIPTHVMPTGAIPVGGDCDFIMFTKNKDYKLKVKVWGYYSILD